MPRWKSPGVVFHTGRWYVVGHDHLRDGLRTFRIDRIASVTARSRRFTAPDGLDPVAHLTSTLAQGPYRWQVEVTIHGPLDEIARRLPRSAFTLTAQPSGVLMHARAERLDGMAHLLASLEWPFAVHHPDEPRQALKNLADQLTAAAERGPVQLPQQRSVRVARLSWALDLPLSARAATWKGDRPSATASSGATTAEVYADAERLEREECLLGCPGGVRDHCGVLRFGLGLARTEGGRRWRRAATWARCCALPIRSLRRRGHRHITYIRVFGTWIRVPDGIEHPDPFLVVRGCNQFC